MENLPKQTDTIYKEIEAFEDYEILENIIYKNGVKIGAMGIPKLTNMIPSSLSRDLKLEEYNGMKFYHLNVNTDGKLVGKFPAEPKEFRFLNDNIRKPKKIISIFAETSERLEKFSKESYDDLLVSHTTNFSTLVRNENNNKDVNDLIRMAHNVGFYVKDRHIIIGTPSRYKTLEQLVEIIFTTRKTNKDDLKGIYRNFISLCLLMISYRYNVDIKAIRKFWAFAFYMRTDPDEYNLLNIQALEKQLDKRKSCPFFEI